MPETRPDDRVAPETGPRGARAARTPWGWWVAWAWLGAVVLAAVFAPLLPLWDPTIPDYRNVFGGITPTHWLGGDTLGRDTFSRVVYGATCLAAGRHLRRGHRCDRRGSPRHARGLLRRAHRARAGAGPPTSCSRSPASS